MASEPSTPKSPSSLTRSNLPTNPNDLLRLVNETAVIVREVILEQRKIELIKNDSDFVNKIDEILTGIEDQADKILKTCATSRTVLHYLMSLCETILEVKEFYIVLKSIKFMFLGRSKLKKRASELHATLRAKWAELLAATSLELGNPTLPTPIPILSSSEITEVERRYQEGNKFYYGICTSRNYTEAFACYLYAAERGHVESMIMIADCYTGGKSVEKDVPKGMQWLERGVALKSNAAKYKLGVVLIDQINEVSDDFFRDNFRLDGDVEQPETDDSTSQYLTEKMNRAVRLIFEAADGAHPEALCFLGQLFEMSKEYAEAQKRYEAAAKLNCPAAVNCLGMMYFDGLGVKKRHDTAYSLFERAALCGNEQAINNMAMCLEHGHGVEKDTAAAMDMYLTAAKAGSVNAAYSYGHLSIKMILEQRDLGHSVIRNIEETTAAMNTQLKEGIRWLRLALENGVADAGYQLGLLYNQGVGVPQDREAAYSYFAWAADKNHAKAAFQAANILNEKTFEQPKNAISSMDIQTVIAMYRLAAELGHGESMHVYALMLEDGSASVSGAADIQGAIKWYIAAINAGYHESASSLYSVLLSHPEIESVETLSGDVMEIAEVQNWVQELVNLSYALPKKVFQPESGRVTISNEKKENSTSFRIPNSRTIKSSSNAIDDEVKSEQSDASNRISFPNPVTVSKNQEEKKSESGKKGWAVARKAVLS